MQLFKVVLTFEVEEEAEICKLFRSLTLPLWECKSKASVLKLLALHQATEIDLLYPTAMKKDPFVLKKIESYAVIFFSCVYCFVRPFSQLACIVYRCPEQFFLPSGVRTGRPIKKRNNILRKRRLVSPFFSFSSFLSVPFMFHLSFDIFTRRVFVKTVQFLNMLSYCHHFLLQHPGLSNISNQTKLAFSN